MIRPLPPDHYWKTPFVWEPGCPAPSSSDALTYEAAQDAWLQEATAQVMSSSLDEADQVAVRELGASQAAAGFLSLASQHFVVHRDWWRLARDESGEGVGFILPVLFHGEGTVRAGRPEGTIFYMGVLPAHRGRGHGVRLLAEATRILIEANCWRILCDTGTDNVPMVAAFRRSGYIEREPWSRPVH